MGRWNLIYTVNHTTPATFHKSNGPLYLREPYISDYSLLLDFMIQLFVASSTRNSFNLPNRFGAITSALFTCSWHGSRKYGSSAPIRTPLRVYKAGGEPLIVRWKSANIPFCKGKSSPPSNLRYIYTSRLLLDFNSFLKNEP